MEDQLGFGSVVTLAFWLICLRKAGQSEDYRECSIPQMLWNILTVIMTALAFGVLVKWFAPPL